MKKFNIKYFCDKGNDIIRKDVLSKLNLNRIKKELFE